MRGSLGCGVDRVWKISLGGPCPGGQAGHEGALGSRPAVPHRVLAGCGGEADMPEAEALRAAGEALGEAVSEQHEGTPA